MRRTEITTVLSIALLSLAASWSPDGKRIAYSFIGGPENIYLVNADGTGNVPLVVREQRDFQPEWAPDGSHLVFTSVVDGVHVLMRVNPDGTGLKQISKVEEAAGDPDYSPDGRRLVYFTDKPRPRDLFVRDVETGEVAALTETPEFDEYSPRWAPDGRRIAFVGKKSADKDAKGDIWVLDSATGKERNATATPEVDEFHPAWSHDGTRLVYIRNIDGKFSVGMRDADGNETIVADGKGYAVLSPHFSTDDRSVTFTRTDFEEKGAGMPAIVRVSLDDRSETLIVKGLYLSQMGEKQD